MFLNICKVLIFVFLFCINCMNVCVIGELGKEVNEKIKEGSELHDLKSNIIVGADGNEDFDAANSVDTEKCKADFPQCAETGGECSLESDGKIICTCPQDTAYAAEVGCKVTNYTCSDHYPFCEETGGSCIENKDNEILCNCPKDIEYNNDTGCKITSTSCWYEYPYCEETGGYCIKSKDNKILCNCPADTEYNNDTGCKVTNYSCSDRYPFCEETGGSCIENKDNESLCNCPADTVYINDTGCKVTFMECWRHHRYCEKTGGFCVKNKDSKVMCRCTTGGGSIKEDDFYARYVYNISKGCEITGFECWNHGLCKETGGYCTKNKDKGIICNCPENTVYKTDEGCEVLDPCSDDPCENDGRCVTVGKNFKCICKELYSGQFCENELITNYTCFDRYPLCKETGGYCIKNKDNEILCNCPKDTEYNNDTGCIMTYGDCWYKDKFCAATRGYCKKNEDKEIVCKCPEGAVYTYNRGCEVAVKGFECQFSYPFCEKTGGFCVKNREKKVICRCTAEKEDTYARYVYNTSRGCEVNGSDCLYHYALCKETGGYCTNNKVEGILCKCPEDTVYNTGKGCEVSDPCNDDPCENDGICIAVGKNFKCICEEHYAGKFCEKSFYTRFIIFASILAILSLAGIIASCILCYRIRSMKTA